MTLIECFTESHIDNIASCPRLRPQTLIMIGSETDMRPSVVRYQKLLKNRGLSTQIQMSNVYGKSFREICTILKRLVRDEPECVIDLTGGDEAVIMAVGAVLADLDEQSRERIHVEKFDYRQEGTLDCIHNNCLLPRKNISFSVEELILLHGGSIHPAAYQPPLSCTRSDLDPLWDIVRDCPKEWNRALTLLNEFESRSASKTEIRLQVEHLRSSITDFAEKEAVVRDLLDKLENRGIIDNRSDPRTLRYTYRSSVARYCTQKAGNVLEMKTLLEGRSVLENGAPYFQDCRTSVSIDWDGIIHKPADRVPETRNEIDVVLMRGTIPLFISCKNGNIGEEELYKLHTVAARFGGPHARKMLIATVLDQKTAAANRSFTQRAWDMDIFLVPDAADMTSEEWRKIFYQAMQ